MSTAPRSRCPLCGSTSQLAFVTTDRNRHATDAAFRYERCGGCQVLYLANPPADLERYYVSDYHVIPERAQLDASSAREAYKVDVLRRHMSRGRIVDVGPGFGGFPHLANRAGYKVTAIEVDARCCEFIESVVGARAVQSGQPERALAQFNDLDAVTLWHSIEHVTQPWRTIAAAAAALRTGGVLIVATPNPIGFEAHLLGRRWAHVDAPRHLFLIPPGALAARATALGMQLTRTFADDEETRRCNVFGWHHALHDAGVHAGPLTPFLARGVERAVRGLERRPTLGSAYTSVFVKA
jgi:2-polyprenyl-3-methyl-5-hydroxy-6-metoxy-1,4-benzoquinol methylase